ncbi:hypothetical protein LTR36_002310 [Oleoguttula mirabilis]|uniref:Uncharacterized protein n=1 Tax=Oleoguttula mirabilis TaxID=1507867 RepID=A0AAV9JNP5_9PEZI|nr:hypothetical protein LTR36_002310 [Oleoguttula mirabilis]
MANGDVRSIIDTRKRKSISSSNTGEGWSPRNKKKARNLCHDELRRLVYPDFIQKDKFDVLEQMFVGREDEIVRRGEEILALKKQLGERDHLHDRRKRQIDELKNKLEDAERVRDRQDERLFEQEKKIKHMRQTSEQQYQEHVGELAGLERQYEEQETAIHLSSALLKRAHEERDQQKQQLFERDVCIETLNDGIHKMATALPCDAAQLALENQAHRHLAVMQGLQTDVAQRDAFIDDLQAEHAAALEAQEALASKRISAEIRGLEKRHDDARRSSVMRNEAATARRISSEVRVANKKTEDAQQRAREAEKRVVAAEKVVEAAGKRAEELKAATVDQKGLIDRLMTMNKTLAAQQT